MKTPQNINPYANPDGTPKDGKEAEFFKWGEEQRDKKMDELPPVQRRKREQAEQALDDRMNS